MLRPRTLHPHFRWPPLPLYPPRRLPLQYIPPVREARRLLSVFVCVISFSDPGSSARTQHVSTCHADTHVNPVVLGQFYKYSAYIDCSIQSPYSYVVGLFVGVVVTPSRHCLPHHYLPHNFILGNHLKRNLVPMSFEKA